MMVVVSLITGIVSWTLVEYLLHRYLGHEHKGKNFFKKEHVMHHVDTHYFAPLWKKIIAAALVAMVMISIISLFATIEIALAFTIGLILMFSVYEWTHYRFHAARPLKIFIVLRKHHFYHHFHNPKMNHGVTTRFWDRVFGTYYPVENPVKLPRKHAPNWVMDDTSLQVLPDYQSHFILVGK